MQGPSLHTQVKYEDIRPAPGRNPSPSAISEVLHSPVRINSIRYAMDDDNGSWRVSEPRPVYGTLCCGTDANIK